MYVDYNYYSDVYGGSLVTSSDFSKYELKARLLLDSFTLKKKMTEDLLETEFSDNIKMTICELIDNTVEEERLLEQAQDGLAVQLSGLSSEVVKDHTYNIDTKGNVNDRVRDYIQNKDLEIMTKYLLPTGLLYRGAKYV